MLVPANEPIVYQAEQPSTAFRSAAAYGMRLALFRPNGAGKTTTVRMLSGLLTPPPVVLPQMTSAKVRSMRRKYSSPLPRAAHTTTSESASS